MKTKCSNVILPQDATQMTMMWPYALLSKMAAENGGPEKFVNKLIKYGSKEGKKSMIPIIAASGVMNILLSCIAVPELKERICKGRKEKGSSVKTIKSEKRIHRKENYGKVLDRESGNESLKKADSKESEVSIEEIWENAKVKIKDQYSVSNIEYKTWIEPLELGDICSDVIFLKANLDDQLKYEYVGKRFLPKIEAIIGDMTEQHYKIEFMNGNICGN